MGKVFKLEDLGLLHTEYQVVVIDYKAMTPYIDIADDIRVNAMSKFYQL